MVAGAVEQDGDSAGVCHQKWGGGDSIPAVGPCREGAMKGTGAPQRWAQAPRPVGCHLPWPSPCQGWGRSGIWTVLRVAPATGWPHARLVPALGWSYPDGGPTPRVTLSQGGPVPGWFQPQGGPIPRPVTSRLWGGNWGTVPTVPPQPRAAPGGMQPPGMRSELDQAPRVAPQDVPTSLSSDR